MLLPNGCLIDEEDLKRLEEDYRKIISNYIEQIRYLERKIIIYEPYLDENVYLLKYLDKLVERYPDDKELTEFTKEAWVK